MPRAHGVQHHFLVNISWYMKRNLAYVIIGYFSFNFSEMKSLDISNEDKT